jgi:hypothetical protein
MHQPLPDEFRGLAPLLLCATDESQVVVVEVDLLCDSFRRVRVTTS